MSVVQSATCSMRGMVVGLPRGGLAAGWTWRDLRYVPRERLRDAAPGAHVRSLIRGWRQHLLVQASVGGEYRGARQRERPSLEVGEAATRRLDDHGAGCDVEDVHVGLDDRVDLAGGEQV